MYLSLNNEIMFQKCYNNDPYKEITVKHCTMTYFWGSMAKTCEERSGHAFESQSY